MNSSDMKKVFNSICDGTIKATFIGEKIIKDYLCYVLGNDIEMECLSGTHLLNGNEQMVIYDDVICKISSADKYKSVPLSCFVESFNSVEIPKDRELALWGGGLEMESKLPVIRKYKSPKIIIDKNKNGNYDGIPFVKPEKLNIKDYFIIITTTKYAGEVKAEIERNGCEEGKDFILGSNPAFLSDSAAMFLKVISARPLKRIKCRRPFEYVNVGVGGNLTHCCHEWLPYYTGNVLNGDTSVCDTITSRIIRLSFMNQSYVFCNTVLCPWMAKEREKLYVEEKEMVDEDVYLKPQKIVDVDVAFDNTCNLFCESCRKGIIIERTDEPMIIARNISKTLLPGANRLTVAGNGEAFLSKAYAEIFNGNFPNTHLTILSNGNLFTVQKWKTVEGHFKDVQLMFSIDAVTKETYEKVRRGGHWGNVMRGLETASQLRKEGKICRFIIRFVVSRRNYMEMPDFVRLGKKMNCDIVDFSRIENWGTFTDDEFEVMSMFDGDTPKPEMREVLIQPIMKDSIVRYTNISF